MSTTGGGKLALLADGHETLAAALGQGRGEDEPARLDAGDGVDGVPLRLAEQALDRRDRGRECRRNSGLMSRNRMPGCGKSGMSTTNCFRSCMRTSINARAA